MRCPLGEKYTKGRYIKATHEDTLKSEYKYIPE